MSSEITFLEFAEPTALLKEDENQQPPISVENMVEAREANLETLTTQITAASQLEQLEKAGIVDMPAQTYTKKAYISLQAIVQCA